MTRSYTEWCVRTDDVITSSGLSEDQAWRIKYNIERSGRARRDGTPVRVEVVSREVTLTEYVAHELPEPCPDCKGEGFHNYGCWEATRS